MADHLFKVAAAIKTDKIEGVSKSIIMGQFMSIGTGLFNVVCRMGLPKWFL
jgi:DNA-directed RNA polymerase III subunit RPC1